MPAKKIMGKKVYLDTYYASLARKGKQNAFWKGGKISIKCTGCGISFEKHPCRVNRKNNNNYCSFECMKEFYSLRRAKIESQKKRRPISRSYTAIHGWVRRRKQNPGECEICHKKKPVELSNTSGKYLKDIGDYRWLCRKCHVGFDRKRTWIKSTCTGCGKEQLFPKGREKIFCSEKCMIKAYRTGDNKPCMICGKVFHISEYHIKKGKKYCSRGCYFYARKTKGR